MFFEIYFMCCISLARTYHTFSLSRWNAQTPNYTTKGANMTFWQSREEEEEKRDVIFKIEENWESCQSNRAHYHEIFVHYPASFVPKVRRVMFLGGKPY